MAGLFATLRSGQAISIDSYLGPADGVGTVFEAVHESGVPLQYPRLLFALIGSICPVLIYVALRRYFGVSVWISLAGGVILAGLTPQVVYYSSFIMPDSGDDLAMGAVLAGMESSAHYEPVDFRWLAATLAGVAVSVSMRYVGLIPMPFLALALSGSRQKWGRRVGLIAAGLTLGFVATSPTLLVDLPGYLGRLAGFSWFGDDSLPNRMVSLSFYLRGAFLGPARLGIEQAEGEGLGLIVLGLFLVGYVVALQGQRKPTVFLTLVALFHLLVITSTRYRYERHALVLYPLLAIFAAVGLGFAQQQLSSALGGLRMRKPSRWLPAGAIPALVSHSAALPGGSAQILQRRFIDACGRPHPNWDRRA
jgi:hypothetical protein